MPFVSPDDAEMALKILATASAPIIVRDASGLEIKRYKVNDAATPGVPRRGVKETLYAGGVYVGIAEYTEEI